MIATKSEILGLAVKIEREGRLFYSNLSKSIDDPTIRDFLKLMEKEEAAHEIHFKKLLETKDIFGWENDVNLKQLIKEKFQTDIFPPLEETLAQLPHFDGIEKAFNFAIEAEKVSIEFYRLLGDACTDFEIKTQLALLEKAEREHLNIVETLKIQFLDNVQPGPTS
ncbi:MAG: ferritin family protein [Nitrospina sp.]|jgi:rubrerythrin|nr:ferritin family protein [Nitrospina sp.]